MSDFTKSNLFAALVEERDRMKLAFEDQKPGAFQSMCALDRVLEVAALSPQALPAPGEVEDKGNHDCLAKRRPGEPMFILLGRDPDAWQIVRAWAARRLNAGGDPEHCLLGMKTANAMREYAADPANRPASAPDASAYPTLATVAAANDEGVAQIIEQEAVDIITDLIGPQAAQSGTNCRVVEDHLRQFIRLLSQGEGA